MLKSGGPCGDRTRDTRIKSPVLCQLSAKTAPRVLPRGFYFGRGPMGRSFGWQQFGAGTGMAFGAWVGGALFAVFGSYSPTIILSVAASVTGAIVLLSMEPTVRLLIPNWEDSLPSEARTETLSTVGAAD